MENPWKELLDGIDKTSNNFIHPAEKNLIEEFNNSLKSKYKDTYKIHTEIIPAPFMGNVHSAKILLLTLNPGFDEKENTKDETGKNFYELFQDWFLKELVHQNDLRYPLYCLDDKYCKYSVYWKNKLKFLCDKFNKDKVAKEICKVQFFPYNSKKFRKIPLRLIQGRTGSNYLKTQLYNFFFVKKAMENNRLIILTRGKNLWYDAIKGLKSYHNKYETKSYSNISITPGNLSNAAYEKIFEILK